ncbi:sensor histidine kinase [Pseudomonas sp. ML96]|uniref:HAMP domain-containing sensor histidine kinase n=1 Tax=Pseudomonas sp. ML96 TaxID=1523503 RepID=UPI0005BCEBF4|nr:sensor histidine kinase [Pseudomonas sp. ML96]
MSMQLRHSLFWKLAGLLGLFCLLLLSLASDLGWRVIEMTSRLPREAREQMQVYATQAEASLRSGGPQALGQYLEQLQAREQAWAVVVDESNHSLSDRAVPAEIASRLSFIRPLSGSMGRPDGRPNLYIPFSDGQARLVMQLPERLSPRQHLGLYLILLQKVLPTVLAVLFGLLLYRLLISPLVALRRQAQALSGGDMSARAGDVSRRRDELGELGRAFDHMAERLQHTVGYQRQLLRDLSHEMRTPLARLRVAAECVDDAQTLRRRLELELECMQQLVDGTLELVWLDTERPHLQLEDIDVPALWGVLAENACFESGWPAERLRCELPSDCRVRGHLNGLAQALENILRNAIRHSPEQGMVRLSGRHKDGRWRLSIEDQGGGVPAAQLGAIFHPFTRLNASRPGGEGFGLGLAIARGAVRMQGGELWAENGAEGLRLQLSLASV